MSNNKKYLTEEVLFRTKCINDDNTSFLNIKWYDVIDFTTNSYLIRFNSGGAKWYNKNRFAGYWKQ